MATNEFYFVKELNDADLERCPFCDSTDLKLVRERRGDNLPRKGGGVTADVTDESLERVQCESGAIMTIHTTTTTIPTRSAGSRGT